MRSSSKKQLIGLFVAGAATGAAVALLFAPKNGTQTRKDIRRFSKRTASQLESLQEDFRDQINDGYQQVVQAIENVKEYVEDGRSRLKKMIQTA
jgi:gas vesicle protein